MGMACHYGGPSTTAAEHIRETKSWGGWLSKESLIRRAAELRKIIKQRDRLAQLKATKPARKVARKSQRTARKVSRL